MSLPAVPASLTSYQKKLLIFLCGVAFFEGYDLFAMSQTLPNLRAAFDLLPAQGGRMLGIANIGTIVAYLLIRLADRWGRRPMMLLSLAGYTLTSFLSGFAPDVYFFTGMQFLVRVFLVSALALSSVYAAEEYPAERRGRIAGLIQGCLSLGAICSALTAPALLKTGYGWRGVYWMSLLAAPLLLFAGFKLHETQRFLSAGQRAQLKEEGELTQLLKPPYRRRMLQFAVIWAATYSCTQCVSAFWKEYALTEKGMSNAQIGAYIGVAALLAIPMVMGAGRLIDTAGRRRGAVVLYLCLIVGTLGGYLLPTGPLAALSLIAMIGAAASTAMLLFAWTAECFPTELRSAALAWSNNLIGRVGFVAAPLLVAELVGTLGWGRSVALTTVFAALALLLIGLWLPETARKELEDSAKMVR